MEREQKNPQKDYGEYANISIFDTGLIAHTVRAERYVQKNGISTLKEVFEKYDEGFFDLTKAAFGRQSHISRTIRLTIELIRCKFLHTDLSFPLNPQEKHPRGFWFYTEQDKESKSIPCLYDVGSLRQEVDLYYQYGINWSHIISESAKTLGENFSFFDIMLNPRFIASLKDIPTLAWKNCILVVCDYCKRAKEELEHLDDTTDPTTLFEEEKRLLQELASLNDRSAEIIARLTEIRAQKEEQRRKQL